MIGPRIAELQIMLLALDEDEAETLNRPTTFPGPAQLRQRLGFPGNLIEALKACRETESRPWKSGASESAHSPMSG